MKTKRSACRIKVALALATALLTLGCESNNGTRPDDGHLDFLVDVNGETFVMRASDPVTVQQAAAILQGGESMFPIGPLRRGDGGFNAPWSWHMDPAEVRLTQIAVEVCDGLPSYVEENLEDFLRPGVGYCPWSAKIVARASGTGPLRGIVEPIEIDDVVILVAEAAPRVSAHVRGRIGDSCSTLRPVEQQRSGNRVTVSITRTRAEGAVCLELLQLLDEVIPLKGEFSTGRYFVAVNSVERSFSIP